MKNLLQTHSIAWAQGVRVALEAEGIPCQVLNEFDRGQGLMPYIPVRVVVLNDGDFERAQAIAARLAPPREAPGAPPSWRWQKRGLLILGLDLVLFATWGALSDRYVTDQEGSRLVLNILAVLVVLCLITGMLFIFLGPRADRTKGAP